MDPKQKILFTQLQIAGAGVIIAVFGWLANQTVLMVLGGGVILLGLVRAFLFGKFLNLEEITPEDIAQYNESLQNDEDEDDDW
ncbi:MAG: hypothetical protein HUJ55_01700 [Ileibacterium sp.]|nr:hypothetical protein [Ileibacterium sp.]